MDTFLEDLMRERSREIARQIARQLVALGNDSLEEIAKATGLTLEEVTALAQEQSA